MRGKGLAVGLAALGAAFGTAARAADEAADPAAAKKGQVTYVRYCVACHGQTGKGDGSLAGDLRHPVPDLTTLSARSKGAYPYERVVRIINSGETLRGHGTADMPAWGDAFKRTRGTEERTPAAAVRNLAHYLWSIQQP
jgi:mono/diheme cytochrome c family protein